jgi:hypothetical protein
MICSSSSEDDEDDETIPDAPVRTTGGGQLKVPNGSAPRYDRSETNLIQLLLLINSSL